jgi:signal transduction histidine kinase
MKILLFDAGTPGGVSLRAALHSLGHDVQSTGIATLPVGLVDIAIAWYDPALPPAIPVLQQLRSALPPQVPLRLASPLGVIAEDILPWPAAPSLLAARLAQPRRVPSLGRLAHDFNNLLTAIQGHAELALLSPKLDPNTRHSLSQIHASAVGAIDLTRQLRDATKPDSIQSSQSAASSGTVLLIDPDDATRRVAHRFLRRAGYVVFEVASVTEGLDLMAQIAPALDAIILDPIPAGAPVFENLLRLRPGAHLVVWSDATEDAISPLLPPGVECAFVLKPHAGGLAGAIESLTLQPARQPGS